MDGMAKTPAANHYSIPMTVPIFFSSHGGKITISMQKNTTRYTDGCSIFSPDEDDYKKLSRVKQYIMDMWDMTLTIEPNDQPQWWVDSSYAVHPDMKSHTGIFMTFGKCSMYTSS